MMKISLLVTPTAVKNSMAMASTTVRKQAKFMKDSGKTTKEMVTAVLSTLI
jgi:hypothetical protein